jgi:intein/homing endonuclease
MISFAKIMRQVLTETMSFRDLLQGSESGRKQRARTDVNVKPMRVTTMDGKEAWTFSYKSSPSTTGNRWHGNIQFLKGTVSEKDSAEDLDCRVSCNCPDYRFRYAYNNYKAGSGNLGNNNGRAPKPRSQGGVGDYGNGMCIAKGELVSTARGFIPIEEVSDNDKVWTLDGWKQVLGSALTGHKQILELVLSSGRILKLTPDHKVFVFNEPLGFMWKETRDLNINDFLCVTLPANINHIPGQFHVSEYHGDKLVYPDQNITLNATMAELMGYMIAEGSKCIFSNFNTKLNEDFYLKWCSVFGHNSCSQRKDGCYIGTYGTKILIDMGFKLGSYNKDVPDWIMQSDKETIIAFLRGCYAGDGNFRNRHSTYATVSYTLAKKIHILLEFIGVRTSINCYKSGVNHSNIWVLRTSCSELTDKLFLLLNPIRGYSSYDYEIGHGQNKSNKGLASHNFLIKGVYRFFYRIAAASIPECNDNNIITLKDAESRICWITPMYKKTLVKLFRNRGIIKKIPMNLNSTRMISAAKMSDIYAMAKNHHIKKILHSIGIRPGNQNKIHKTELCGYLEKFQGILPEAYEKIKLLSRNDVSVDKVKLINKVEQPTDVYDLTVETSEHFTVNGVVVHNCKHLLALGKYLQTQISTPEAPEPDDKPPMPEKKPIQKPMRPAVAPQTIQAPDPDEDSYTDTRSGSDTLQESKIYELMLPLLNNGTLYNRIDQFAKKNPEFEVMYEDD